MKGRKECINWMLENEEEFLVSDNGDERVRHMQCHFEDRWEDDIEDFGIFDDREWFPYQTNEETYIDIIVALVNREADKDVLSYGKNSEDEWYSRRLGKDISVRELKDLLLK